MLLAVFSANGFTSFHPSVEEGDSRSNSRPTALNLRSTIRIRVKLPGTVACVVGEEDENVVELDRRGWNIVRESVALRERGRGIAFRCASVQTRPDLGVEWFLNGRLPLSEWFSTGAGKDVVLNSDLTAWPQNKLWSNGTGPWTRSLTDCPFCRVKACGVTETAELCDSRRPPRLNPSPSFPSILWYIAYAVIVAYVTN